ncbi:hypothetical protein F3Y22_tig00110121pilonHSYRG00038 [Hibiscus syriacus]|uniref:Uncharacterized protein n=1 Tax=Hibiscus syriacus TaxID=106335 RepID=A0A6A3BK12_HIBSY|nr:hypothetical protein F3Y22_tig00110121pilonHSYRG00038 [Hibiscus syriacus]
MTLRLMKPLLSSSTCLLFFFFLVVSFWCSQSINAQKAATDPSKGTLCLSGIELDLPTMGYTSSGYMEHQWRAVQWICSQPVILCLRILPITLLSDVIVLSEITLFATLLAYKRGVIPQELLDLPYLTSLKPDRNFFSGCLPTFVGKLSRLGLLSISHKDLSEPIPKELGNLKDLYYLNFGVNNFSGTLPPELGNLVKLGELCRLGGKIPSTFAKLVQLRTVWASDNAFTSKIPEFVGNN